MNNELHEALVEFAWGSHIFTRKRHKLAVQEIIDYVVELEKEVKCLKNQADKTGKLLTSFNTDTKEKNQELTHLEEVNKALNTSVAELTKQVDNYDFRATMLEREADDWKLKYETLFNKVKAIATE